MTTNEERDTRHRQTVKEYYKRRKALGLCTQCGKHNDRVPMTRCSTCRHIEAVKRAEEMPLAVLCRCGQRRVYRATMFALCWMCRTGRTKQVK